LGFPSKSIFLPPKKVDILLIITPLVARAYVNKKPIATDDIRSGINQRILNNVIFLPPKSISVARSNSSGIYIHTDRNITIKLFLNPAKNFPSLSKFIQFARPTNLLSYSGSVVKTKN